MLGNPTTRGGLVFIHGFESAGNAAPNQSFNAPDYAPVLRFEPSALIAATSPARIPCALNFYGDSGMRGVVVQTAATAKNPTTWRDWVTLHSAYSGNGVCYYYNGNRFSDNVVIGFAKGFVGSGAGDFILEHNTVDGPGCFYNNGLPDWGFIIKNWCRQIVGWNAGWNPPNINIDAITNVGGRIQVTTSVAHHYIVGDQIDVAAMQFAPSGGKGVTARSIRISKHATVTAVPDSKHIDTDIPFPSTPYQSGGFVAWDTEWDGEAMSFDGTNGPDGMIYDGNVTSDYRTMYHIKNAAAAHIYNPQALTDGSRFNDIDVGVWFDNSSGDDIVGGSIGGVGTVIKKTGDALGHDHITGTKLTGNYSVPSLNIEGGDITFDGISGFDAQAGYGYGHAAGIHIGDRANQINIFASDLTYLAADFQNGGCSGADAAKLKINGGTPMGGPSVSSYQQIIGAAPCFPGNLQQISPFSQQTASGVDGLSAAVIRLPITIGQITPIIITHGTGGVVFAGSKSDVIYPSGVIFLVLNLTSATVQVFPPLTVGIFNIGTGASWGVPASRGGTNGALIVVSNGAGGWTARSW